MPADKIYLINYDTYMPFLGRLKYLKSEWGQTLRLNPGRFRTFLRNTGLHKVTESQISWTEYIPVLSLDAPPPEPEHNLPHDVTDTFTFNPDFQTLHVEHDRYGWDGRSWPQFQTLLRQLLAPAVNKRIKVNVPHNARFDYNPEGDFNVLVWSSPTQPNAGVSTPRTMFGERTPCTDGSFTYDGHGLPIVSPEGDTVAELFQNALYIYHDAVHYGNSREFRLFSKLLQAAAKLYTETDWSDFEAARAIRAAEAAERGMQEFIRACAGRNARRQRTTLETLEQSIREKSDELFRLERQLANGKAALVTEDPSEKFLAEFRKLNDNFENVESATFTDGALVVLTSGLHANCQHTGQVYDLGQVELKLDFRLGEVWMRDPSGERVIPHTNEGYGAGNFATTCLGTAYTEVRKYLANYEMMCVVTFMMAFLQNGIDTEDEWGVLLEDHYPLVTS